MNKGQNIPGEIVASFQRLRRYAFSLCRNADRADDLVQDTMLLAFGHLDSFVPGTNLNAWLFAILRNRFRTECRRRSREVEDVDGFYAATLKSRSEQSARIGLYEVCAALNKLTAEQREALIMVAAMGLPLDDVAKYYGCPVGTIKSRVHRARTQLMTRLAIEGTEDFGPDPVTRGVA